MDYLTIKLSCQQSAISLFLQTMAIPSMTANPRALRSQSSAG
jgi:hypothetical protein